MENENFGAPNEPLMSTHQHANQPANVKTVNVSITDDEEAKKKFLSEGDGAHFTKDKIQVSVKQAPKFVGLTQEELKRYADDPFWRRLRIALFALFWLAWIAMFVIAIILVATSPKCPDKPHRSWWQKKLCYQIYTRSFKDSDGDGVGDIRGMTEQLPTLQKLGVQTVWPVPIIRSADFSGYDVVDFHEVDNRLGTVDDFTAFAKAAHENDMYVVIDLPLTTTSAEHPWFKESVLGNSKRDYYYWQPRNSSGNWEKEATTDQYYMVFNKTKWPVLNWSSNPLRREIKNVMKTWLERGVDGFYLGNIELMSVWPDGSTNWENVDTYLVELKEYLATYRNETGRETTLFTSLTNPSDNDNHELKNKLTGQDGLEMIINLDLTDVNHNCRAECLREKIVKSKSYHDSYNETWPMWELGNPYVHRIASRLGNVVARTELMQMLLFMLDGSLNWYYGDEIPLYDTSLEQVPGNMSRIFRVRSLMQWDSSINSGFSSNNDTYIKVNQNYQTVNLKERLTGSDPSAAKLFRRMSEWRRNDEAFLYGTMSVGSADPDIIVIRRNAYQKSSNYYAILNFGANTVQLNMKEKTFDLPIPAGAETTVGAMTSNLAMRNAYYNRDAIDIEKVELRKYEGIIIKYK